VLKEEVAYTQPFTAFELRVTVNDELLDVAVAALPDALAVRKWPVTRFLIVTLLPPASTVTYHCNTVKQ